METKTAAPQRDGRRTSFARWRVTSAGLLRYYGSPLFEHRHSAGRQDDWSFETIVSIVSIVSPPAYTHHTTLRFGRDGAKAANHAVKTAVERHGGFRTSRRKSLLSNDLRTMHQVGPGGPPTGRGAPITFPS